jgi:hypothetical protein
MVKRRLPSPRKKSARDKAIDQILLAAADQTTADGGSSVLVRLTGRGSATTATTVKKAETKPADDAAKPVNAMALAFAKAGVAASTPPVPPKAQKPLAKPTKSTAAPAPARQPPPAPQPSRSKAKPAKLPKQKASKPGKNAKKQKTLTPFELRNREAAEREREEKIREHEKAIKDAERAVRITNQHKEAARAIANIGQASPDELLDLWRANIARLDNAKSAFSALARDYIEAIESEWTRRSIIARLDPDYFKWPSTKAAPGNGSFTSIDHAEGILGYLGYHVGKTGEASSARRQALLSRAFKGPLPPINDPEYMCEWGRPGSAVRLEKMAVSIASVVKSAKRQRDADYSVAIDHWEEDLKFLYREYYVRHFRFDWPGSA